MADAPKILGVEMTPIDPKPLAEMWTLRFGCLEIVLGKHSRFNSKLGPWEIGIGDKEDLFVERADAIAAIERELLAIRAAIPEQKEER